LREGFGLPCAVRDSKSAIFKSLRFCKKKHFCELDFRKTEQCYQTTSNALGNICITFTTSRDQIPIIKQFLRLRLHEGVLSANMRRQPFGIFGVYLGNNTLHHTGCNPFPNEEIKINVEHGKIRTLLPIMLCAAVCTVFAPHYILHSIESRTEAPRIYDGQSGITGMGKFGYNCNWLHFAVSGGRNAAWIVTMRSGPANLRYQLTHARSTLMSGCITSFPA